MSGSHDAEAPTLEEVMEKWTQYVRREMGWVKRTLGTEGRERLTGEMVWTGTMVERFTGMKCRKKRRARTGGQTLELVQHALMQAWAPSTWSHYGSIYNTFMAWAQTTEIQGDLTLLIMAYLEEGIADEKDPLSPQTALTYSKALASIFHLQGQEVSPVMRIYRRGLKRRGALVPETQALPATEIQIKESVTDAMTCGKLELAMAIWIAWLTSSRVDEILTRKQEDVVYRGIGGNANRDFFHIYEISFAGHKGDPFQLWGVHIVYLSEPYHRALQAIKARRRPSDQLFQTTYEEMTEQLKRVHPELTGHSVKRGSLLFLLMKDLPLEVIRIAAKHKSIQQLLTYLPAGPVANRVGLADVAAALSGLQNSL